MSTEVLGLILLELLPPQCCQHFECIQSFSGECVHLESNICDALVFSSDVQLMQIKCIAMVVVLLTYYPRESSGVEGFIFL